MPPQESTSDATPQKAHDAELFAPAATASADAPVAREAHADPSSNPPPADATTSHAVSEAPASSAEEGASDDGDDGDDGAESGTEGEAANASGEQVATDPDGKPKRKRKRRRKKKRPDGPGAGVDAAGGEQPQTGEQQPQGEHARAPGGTPSRPPRGKRPQKHRPPSERAPFHVGEEVFGKVTSVLEAAIMVDLSGKALAIFDRSEMEPDDLVPSVGDRFVARVHQDGSRGGLVVLTRKPLREEEAKPEIAQAAKDGTLVKGIVTGVIKGGVEVDIRGLRAFAPASGMDLHPHNANFIELLGQVLDFKVVEYDGTGRDLVVTRRPMLEQEAHERRKKALELLTEGQVMKGVIRTVVEWGAFVALPEAENLEGLVHVSEASHDPNARLTELFHPGEELEVKITKIDERGKIWLSRKALISDPWQDARNENPVGSRHTGKVTRVEKFGVFVEIKPGIDGLIHVSDLTLKKIEHPSELVKVGDDIDVIVNHFDLRTHKVSLHPAPPPEQANEPQQKVVKGGVVKVEVVRGEAAGVIVRLLGVTGRGARGFVPAGQTGTARGTDLRKKFPPGQVLDVKVLELDPRRGEPKLSITRAAEDEERRAHKEYRAQVARENSFGTLGDLLRNRAK
ncbi:MAG TPA: S1 RNA-binding domain-containing protein [Polyangiaceae bacterium]|jgi:small subunit ribosomal protein S1|nr:S1 RNA-binding domain-containing protein [Polyangiaceae bacterium]